MVGFQEVDGFLPFGEPEFGLGHKCLFHYSRRRCISSEDGKINYSPVTVLSHLLICSLYAISSRFGGSRLSSSSLL